VPTLDINLNEVVEKPKLPAAQPFTFAIVQAVTDIAKTPNKKSGVREPLIKATLRVLDNGWEDRGFDHRWSLSSGALSSDDPCFSIKKFFSVVGFSWNPDGKFSTEDIQTLKFVGTVKYKEGSAYPNLATIERGA
jgi:hypothetical protein